MLASNPNRKLEKLKNFKLVVVKSTDKSPAKVDDFLNSKGWQWFNPQVKSKTQMLSYHIHELYFVEFAGCFLVTRWLPCVDREKKPPGSPGATYLVEAVLKLKKIAFGLSIYYPSLYQGQP